MTFKKNLRVALNMYDDDIVKVLYLVDFKISKKRIGGFYRCEDYLQYMDCKGQI